MEALSLARKENFEKAAERLNDCNQELLKSHKFQTELITTEAKGELDGKISILLIHAQDHLMNAMTVKDLAEEIIFFRRDIINRLEEMN